MDMRVFPFSFPPIRGGAQGGVSPTPTPEPEPDPYDVTDAVITLESQGGAFSNWQSASPPSGPFYYTVSGIVVVNSADVSSLKLDFSTLDWTAGGTSISGSTLSAATVDLTPSTANCAKTPKSIKTTDTSVVGKTVGVSGDAVLRAYDSDGNVLQEENITVVGF